jgi:predicted GH43/DUF377 family glycosyl hydrolase
MKKLKILFCYLLPLLLFGNLMFSGGYPPANADSATVWKTVIKDIYEEIKTPYSYGVIMSPGSDGTDYDKATMTSPSIFKIPGDDKYIYMTYAAYDGIGYRTVLAQSDDFVTWKKLGIILNTIDTPHATWDKYNSGGYLSRDREWGKMPVPHVVTIDSPYKGKYVMPYFASDKDGAEAGYKQTGIAFSGSFFNKDGSLTQWKPYSEPINTGTEPYEKGVVWKIEIIRDEANSRYMGFYNAATGPEVMCQIHSTDLIHWTKEPANPVINKEVDPVTGKVWGGGYNADADVMKIGDYWVMLYFTDSPYGIINSFAVSTDMVHWKKSFLPLLLRDQPFNSRYAHKASMAKHNGVVYHFYNPCSDDGLYTLGLNTSIDLSVIKAARTVKEENCSKARYALIQEKLRRLQNELVRNDGSLKKVKAAMKALELEIKN